MYRYSLHLNGKLNTSRCKLSTQGPVRAKATVWLLFLIFKPVEITSIRKHEIITLKILNSKYSQEYQKKCIWLNHLLFSRSLEKPTQD